MTRRLAPVLLAAMAIGTSCQRPGPDHAATATAPQIDPPPSATERERETPEAPSTTLFVASSAPAATTAASTAAPPASAPTSPAPTFPAATVAPAPADDAACLAALPLEWRAGQVLMPAVYGDNLGAARDIIDRSDIGSAILMTWPEGASRDALHELKSSNGVPLLIATDEEGGDVQRLRRLGRIPSAATVAASMSPDDAYQLIATHAAAVRELGIDVVFAPVVDVAPPGGGGPIGGRAFSDDSLIVSLYAAEYVAAWQSAGILPVVKHFPGHGRATADSHHQRSATAPIDQMDDELFPYRQLAGVAPGVMIGHLEVPGLTDGDLPASLSPAAIAFLRDSLGYADALVVTDALNMDAVSARWSAPEAAVLALIAGADVPLYANVDASAAIVDAIVDAVARGSLPAARLDDAVTRVLQTKGLGPCDALGARAAD